MWIAIILIIFILIVLTYYSTKSHNSFSSSDTIVTQNKNINTNISTNKNSTKCFDELTQKEYSQLNIFNKLNEYKRLYENELSFEKGYSKNDILWSIYNQVKSESFIKKDYFNCFLAYNNMAQQLYSEKKYNQALDFLILAIYLRIINISNDCIESQIEGASLSSDFMYERHISKYHKDIYKYIKKNNIRINNSDEMCDLINKIIKKYLPTIQDDFITYWLSFKFNDFYKKQIDT